MMASMVMTKTYGAFAMNQAAYGRTQMSFSKYLLSISEVPDTLADAQREFIVLKFSWRRKLIILSQISTV